MESHYDMKIEDFRVSNHINIHLILYSTPFSLLYSWPLPVFFCDIFKTRLYNVIVKVITLRPFIVLLFNACNIHIDLKVQLHFAARSQDFLDAIHVALNQVLFVMHMRRSSEFGDKLVLDRLFGQVNMWSGIFATVMVLTGFLQVFMIRRLFRSTVVSHKNPNSY